MTDSAGDGHAWLGVHAFFQDDLDLLVTGVVGPLRDELTAGRMADEFFFLRYWEGGPHLRLRVLPRPGVAPDTVRRLVAERFGGYLARHPSTDLLAATQYAALAPQLARQESMRSWTTTMYPNNSIAFIAYRREHGRYGHGVSIQAVERHFVESSRIALQVVMLAAPPERRAALAAACVLATWFAGSADLDVLRTWLHGRIPGGAEPPGTAPAGDLSRMVDLARTTRKLVGKGPGSGAAHGPLAYWTQSMTVLRAALTGAPAAGRDDRILPVLDLCAHLICNRLGISMPAELRLRQLAARAVDVLHTHES